MTAYKPLEERDESTCVVLDCDRAGQYDPICELVFCENHMHDPLAHYATHSLDEMWAFDRELTPDEIALELGRDLITLPSPLLQHMADDMHVWSQVCQRAAFLQGYPSDYRGPQVNSAREIQAMIPHLESIIVGLQLLIRQRNLQALEATKDGLDDV